MKKALLTICTFLCLSTWNTKLQAQFVLYNSVRYNNTPASLTPYLRPINLQNESTLLNADNTPNYPAVKTGAANTIALTGVPVTLDIETWPFSPSSALSNTVSLYNKVIDSFKSVNTTSGVGYYGTVPKVAYNWSNIDPVNNPSGYNGWKNLNSNLSPIAQKVDIFFPSFYVYDLDTSAWRKMVDSTVSAIKRYSTSKPIYAYIWPQYHDGSAYDRQFVDSARWKFQLETLSKRVNGVVIWTSNKDSVNNTISWNPNMQWWRITKEFMVRNGLAQPFVLDNFYIVSGGSNVKLEWNTSADTTTNYFTVQRSTDSVNYTSLAGQVSSLHLPYNQNTYNYTDASPLTAKAYYRLQIIDNAGNTTYSSVVSYSPVTSLFTPGNIAVLRIAGVNGTNGKTGTSGPGSSGVPVHIDEYSVAGSAFTLVRSVDLPATTGNQVFMSSSPNEGYLTLSDNKQYLTLMGYATTGTGTIYSTASNPSIARTLGLIKYDGTANLNTALANFPVSGSAATVQGAVTTNGTDLWAVTSQGTASMGVLYTQTGATDANTSPSVIVSNSNASNRSLTVFGGDLYYVTASGKRIGLVSPTGGLPKGTGNVMTDLTFSGVLATSFSPSQIAMFDMNPSIQGYDVMYVTNTSTTVTTGVVKYCKNAAGTWVAYGGFGSTTADGTYFGITGSVVNGSPVLYVTRGITATGGVATNQLIQLTDAAGYNQTMSATVTASTSALTNSLLRGVAFVPSPSFYYKGSGNVDDVSNWGTNTDGSGGNPSNFTTNNQLFILTNAANATFGSSWTVSGTNAKIVLGDGTTVTSLTIPSNYSINGTIDVYNNATLNIQNTTLPTLGFVGANSTINFNGAATQTIPAMAYGNLAVANKAGCTITGNTTVYGSLTLTKGKLTINTSDTLKLPNSNSILGNFDSTTYIITATDASGNRGVLEIDGVVASTAKLLPVGGAAHYLPATINQSASGSNFYITAFDGITANAQPGGTPLADKSKVVDGVWKINRTGGTTTTNCDVTFGWTPASLQQTSLYTFATDYGIAVFNGTTWPSTTGTANVTNKTVTATFSSFSNTSAYSVWMKAANQQISFDTLATKTYGDPDFALTATSSNNTIPITYTSSNTAVATIVSGQIHIVGAGTSNIKASQAGDGFYTAAPDTIQVLTVNKAPLTVRATNVSMVIGDPIPAFTSTFTGLVNGDVASSFPVTYTPATAPTATGNYNIVPNVATAGNYNITYINGTLTVTAAPLQNTTITFNAIAGKTYGAGDFNTGATSNNTEVAITYTSSNPLVATVDTTGKVHVLSAGTTVITASQVISTHYNAAQDVLQTLVVAPAPLSITADNKTRNQGDTNPTFTITYTGFVKGETSAALTTLPIANTMATTASMPGTYPINVSGAVSSNYSITYVAGTLTVNTFIQQVITFPALPAKNYGDTDFVINATSNSNTIPIVYTSSNPSVATVVSGKLHITGAGTAIVTASQAGDTAHGAATNQVQTLTVNKVGLTITANNQSKYAGQNNPIFTLAYTGFVNGETFAVLTTQPTASSVATVSSPAGTYPITVTGATAANYNINYIGGVLTVNPVSPQTITFNALASKIYGSADFAPGAISSNATIPVTYAGSNTSVATIVNGQIHITGVGTTIITASQAGSVAYTPATDVSQTLTVTPAGLTITADDKTKNEGETNPLLTISYSGFVNGDNNFSLATQPVAITNATNASVIGNYPISVSGASSVNYNITYVTGTLSITPSANNNTELKVYATSPSTLQAQVYSSNTEGVVMVQLIDMNGRVLINKHEYVTKGNNSYVLPIGSLPPGIYSVLVVGNNLHLNKNISIVK